MDSSTIFTSLAKDDSGAFDWLGGVSSKFLNWGQGQPKADAGGCGGTTKGFLQVLPCEKPQNFLCESINPLLVHTNNLLLISNFKDLSYLQDSSRLLYYKSF
jgi:hypothetical protein